MPLSFISPTEWWTVLKPYAALWTWLSSLLPNWVQCLSTRSTAI